MKEHTLLIESLLYILGGYLHIKLTYYRKEKLSEIFFYYTEIIPSLFLVCLGITNSILILSGIGISVDMKYIIFYGAFFILVPISYYYEKHNLEKLNININEINKSSKINQVPSSIYYTKDVLILITILLLIFLLYFI